MRSSVRQTGFLICQQISSMFPAKLLNLLLCFLSVKAAYSHFFLLFSYLGCKMVRAEQYSAEVTDTRTRDQQHHSDHRFVFRTPPPRPEHLYPVYNVGTC